MHIGLCKILFFLDRHLFLHPLSFFSGFAIGIFGHDKHKIQHSPSPFPALTLQAVISGGCGRPNNNQKIVIQIMFGKCFA